MLLFSKARNPFRSAHRAEAMGSVEIKATAPEYLTKILNCYVVHFFNLLFHLRNCFEKFAGSEKRENYFPVDILSSSSRIYYVNCIVK